MLVSIPSFIGLALSVFVLVRALRLSGEKEAAVSRGAIAWAIAFMLFQAFLGVYAALGLIQDDLLSALFANLVLVGCVWMSVNRALVNDRLQGLAGARGRFPHPAIAGTALVLLAALFAGLGLELPSNHDFTWVYPLCMLLEWWLIAFVMLGLYFLFQRRAIAPAILAFVLFGFGVAEYFVITFKSMPIQPGDLSALSTAAAVAGTSYTYSLTAYCVYGLAFCAVALLLCQLAGLFRPDRAARSHRGLLINILLAVVCLGSVGAHVTLIDYYHTLNITVYTWRPLESYWRQGFLPTFISAAQTIKPPVPDDYSVNSAEQLVKEYADKYDAGEGSSEDRAAAEQQFEDEKPTVIAIMNETFSDLSIYQNLHADYQGPQFFKSLNDTLARGTFYVSAYGGGTANTEFEFLTGNSMAYLGPGVYPYTIYDLTETENLAAQFKQLGYATTAMHPNHATNWNRENVYQDLGFDQFLSINDFADADTLRGMVTDQATYDKILQLLDENANPQFIFDVTMQNHSGYTTGLIPTDKQVNLSIDGLSNPEVNEYVSLIQQSDEALRYFIGKLRQLDRKVVVVFFGDHQPFFPSEFNDNWFNSETDAAAHAERLWQTDYMIWANYDVAGRAQDGTEMDTSSNYLGSMLMDLIGAPMSDYQKAHMTLREAMPAINATGYEDRNLQWYLASQDAEGEAVTPAEADADAAHADLATMQYYELFGDGKDVYTKHFQSAANETDPNLAPGTTKVK